MSGNDAELERWRNEMDAAQKEIDQAKFRLDGISERRNSIKSQIESANIRIADIKHSIDEEYQGARYCRSVRDFYGADNHKYRAESFIAGLQREKEIKNSYYLQLEGIKPEYEAALYSLRSAKERKQMAREAFQNRLQYLKYMNEQEKAKWREKNCQKCGMTIRYRIDWQHIPNLCPKCKEEEKAKWHIKPCKLCGRDIRYNTDWEHIPNICKECKEKKSG